MAPRRPSHWDLEYGRYYDDLQDLRAEFPEYTFNQLWWALQSKYGSASLQRKFDEYDLKIIEREGARRRQPNSGVADLYDRYGKQRNDPGSEYDRVSEPRIDGLPFGPSFLADRNHTSWQLESLSQLCAKDDEEGAALYERRVREAREQEQQQQYGSSSDEKPAAVDPVEAWTSAHRLAEQRHRERMAAEEQQRREQQRQERHGRERHSRERHSREQPSREQQRQDEMAADERERRRRRERQW